MNFCRECRWFDPDVGSLHPSPTHPEFTVGRCRKSPPTVRLVFRLRNNPPQADWPMVRHDDWCGAFEQNPENYDD